MKTGTVDRAASASPSNYWTRSYAVRCSGYAYRPHGFVKIGEGCRSRAVVELMNRANASLGIYCRKCATARKRQLDRQDAVDRKARDANG